MSTLQRWLDLSVDASSGFIARLDSPIKEPIREAFDKDPTGMMDLVFTILRENPHLETQVASSIWCLGNLFAKFRGDAAMTPDLRSAALEGYRERNNRACELKLPIRIRQTVRELLNGVLPQTEGSVWRFGPGAVYEHLDAFQRWRVVDTDWDPCNAIAAEQRSLYDQNVACRLCAVPKNAKKARLITVEPALASFWQQHLRQSLLESIHAGPLRGSVEDQLVSGRAEEYQRRRCIRASQTGACSTLDLKDASDCIPWSEVEKVFPAWVVHDMALCRSSSYRSLGEERAIYMYAGMGNASTFVVETLYFWAIFTACAIQTFGSSELRSVSVFGDDVVIPSRYALNPYYCDLVAECGLVLNRTKSCISDLPGLREACGVAALCGCPLAEPVQVKGPYTMEPDDISLCELVTRLDASPVWEHHHFASSLIEACDLRVIHTPSPVANVSVVTTSCQRPERGQVPKRWRSSLQLWEYRVKTRVPVKRNYRLHSLGPSQALAVLSGQIGIQRCSKGRSVIEIDLPHQTRAVWRWVRFYPDPTSLFTV